MPNVQGSQAEFSSISESDSGSNLSDPNAMIISHTVQSAKGEEERDERELVRSLKTQKSTTCAWKFELAPTVMIAATFRDKRVHAMP